MSPQDAPARAGQVTVALLALLVVWAALGCAESTAPTGPTADLRGTWVYSGTQASPARELVGTLVVTAQSGAEITGSLTWEERDGLGGVVNRAAALGGRAIGLADTDFDVFDAEATRRHVARVSANADTVDGVWVASSVGRSGSFRAVRSAVP